MSCLPIATQAEAEAGTANDKAMTPLRTKQAIDALGVSQTALAAPTGGEMVGFQRTGGIARNIASALVETWRVTDFMTEAQIADVISGAGLLDVTVAIQDAVNALRAAGGGTLVFPNGLYKITDTIVVDHNATNVGIILSGAGRGTHIKQTGAGKDAFLWSQSHFLFNSGMRDLQIECDPTAGNCITVGFGMSTNFFHNVEMLQNNRFKHLIYGSFTTDGGIYDTDFRGGSWYCKADVPSAGAVVAGVRIIAAGTYFNENTFSNLRCYNANGEQFFKITAEGGANHWLVNNRWENINFEICKGGGLFASCLLGCNLKNISFWDSKGDYTGNLIELAAGDGYESAANTLESVGRRGDLLAAGVQDIKISSGQDTIIQNCFTQFDDGPRYDFGNKRVAVIGILVGTITNAADMRTFSGGGGMLKFPGNAAFLNYYDEGTWTATLIGSGLSPTVPPTATGQWTRIGRQVNVSVEFANVDTTGGVGNVVISGLPFAVNGTHSNVGTVTTQGLGVAAIGRAAGTLIELFEAASRTTAVTYAAGSGPSAGKHISLTMTYIV
jgi:hypothetical protein